MVNFLKIGIIETEDPYYLVIEITAASERFSGSTIVKVGVEDQLTEFANEIAGFPTSPHDNRSYEFGSSDPFNVKGYCKLRFYCIDPGGHAKVDLEFVDDGAIYPKPFKEASAKFSILIEASDIDRFVNHLRSIVKTQSGEAYLGGAG